MDGRERERQLSVIAELHSILGWEGVTYWLMGGWAVDFHAGRITRDHDDVDLAVWLNDLPRIRELLQRDGWRYSPKEDEDGGTGFEKDGVRLELTFLVRDADGGVYTPLRTGPVVWSRDALGEDVLQLGGVRCRVVSLASLKGSKASPRPERDDALKDTADYAVLSESGADS